MVSLNKKLLYGVPLMAALQCNGDQNLQVLEIQSPVSQPAVKAVINPTKSAIKTILNTLGGDLCESAKAGKINVTPFKLDINEMNEAINPNPLDGKSYGFPKKVKVEDTAKVIELFNLNPSLDLPFCYSLDVLQDSLGKLHLPKDLGYAVHDCFEKSNPYSISGPLFNKLERGLRDNGLSLPLSVCISHYGGDYGPTQANFSDKIVKLTPSCLSTVAASVFGHPPNTIEPYSSFLQNEKDTVLKVKTCVESVIEK